jgi:hypothetical protein
MWTNVEMWRRLLAVAALAGILGMFVGCLTSCAKREATSTRERIPAPDTTLADDSSFVRALQDTVLVDWMDFPTE